MPEKVFLLADDDEDDRELFRSGLQQIDSDVKCYLAEDGFKALELLVKGEIPSPDIIFLDINMPIMSGWECLTQLKKNNELTNIPVIIYSTSSHRRDKDLAIELGAIAFCTKPDDFTELVAIQEFISKTPSSELVREMKKYNENKPGAFHLH